MRKRRAFAKGRPPTWLDAAQKSTLTAIGRALKERFPPSKTLSPAIVSLVSRMNEEPHRLGDLPRDGSATALVQHDHGVSNRDEGGD
jgi:hypothetical protein